MVDERFTVGGGGSSEWEVNADGELVPIDSEPVNVQSVSSESVTTEELSSIYTHRISSASGLESIDATLSQGDTAYVAQPATPYRTSSWIDIDTQDVTVVFESRLAQDGNAIVKPADGADVGGLRIGTGGTTVTNVKVRKFGFNGNASTMTGSVKRLHGVIVENAQNVTVENGYFTNTHPYQSHNDGGSGITVRDLATNVSIYGNYIENIGDRGIQVAGKNINIFDNTNINGFDRGVSLDVLQPDGIQHQAKYVSVVGNYARGLSEGSGIGIKGELSDSYLSIVGNVVEGTHRRCVQILDTKRASVVGNVGFGGDINGIEVSNTGENIVVANNVLDGYSGDGIFSDGAKSIIANNIINSPGQKGINTVNGIGLTVNNLIKNASMEGIFVANTFSPQYIGHNLLYKNDQGGNSVPEISIAGSNAYIVGNHVVSRGGSVSIAEQSGADNNHIVANTVPDDGNAWSIIGSNTRLKANKPTHYDLDETLTGITGSGTFTSAVDRASLGDDIEVRATPDADPDNDLAFQAHPAWDDSAGSLKVVVEELISSGGGDVRVTAKLV